MKKLSKQNIRKIWETAFLTSTKMRCRHVDSDTDSRTNWEMRQNVCDMAQAFSINAQVAFTQIRFFP